VGFALQSFAPPAQPHTVSGAVALLSLKDLRPTAFKKLISVALPKRGAKCQLPSGGLVQASSPSGLYSTRESATSLRLFTPPGARSSPGIHPLQGLPSHRNGTAFTTPPLMGLSVRTTNRPRGRPFRVLLPGEIGLSLSRLPTLMGFVTS
jgi:hypothetical protein